MPRSHNRTSKLFSNFYGWYYTVYSKEKLAIPKKIHCCLCKHIVVLLVLCAVSGTSVSSVTYQTVGRVVTFHDRTIKIDDNVSAKRNHVTRLFQENDKYFPHIKSIGLDANNSHENDSINTRHLGDGNSHDDSHSGEIGSNSHSGDTSSHSESHSHDDSHSGDTESDSHSEDTDSHSEDDGDTLSQDEKLKKKKKKKPWVPVILSSLLINVASLIGVMTFIPGKFSQFKIFCQKSSTPGNNSADIEGENDCNIGEKKEDEQKKGNIFDIVVLSFACGALLATTVFLIIPESLHLIQNAEKLLKYTSDTNTSDHDDHRKLEEDQHQDEDESNVFAIFGVSILSGFVMPLLLGIIFPTAKACDEGCVETIPVLDDCEVNDNASTNSSNLDTTHCSCKSQESKERLTRTTINMKVCLSVLIGDFFHNFCDGVFLGAAFLLCSRNVAYTIMAVTLYHELAQELADFFLLTKHAGLSIYLALTLNFLSGFSVMIGGMITLAIDLNEKAIGVLLAVAAGVYLHIAASECLPRVEYIVETNKDRVISLVIFILGAIPIGLTLLNHSHCTSH